MTVLKTLSLIAAGLLSFLAARLVVREMQAARVKAGSRRAGPVRMRRLRQDPRTGVYYPEN